MVGPTGRMIVVIIAMAIVEVAWALFCAKELPQTSAYLVLFYGGLAAASAVFFIPGLGRGPASSVLHQERTSETEG